MVRAGFAGRMGFVATGSNGFITYDFTDGSIPGGFSVVRGSTGWSFNSSGSLSSASSNTGRLDYNPATLESRGLLIERGSTNLLRNSTMAGFSAGSPGTFPTNWGNNSSGSYTRTTAAASQNGMNAVDFRWQKTDGTSAGFGIYMDTTTGIPAVQNDVVEYSLYARVAGGSLASIAQIRLDFLQRDAGGASAGSSLLGVRTYLTELDSTTLVRISSGPRTVSSATAAYVRPLLGLVDTTGNVDLTLRICGVQVEKNGVGVPTSFIPTSSGAVARADEYALLSDLNILPFNASAGTLVVEYEPLLVSTTTAGTVARFDDTSNDNLIAIGTNTSQNATGSVTAGGSADVTMTAGGVVAGTVNRSAISWEANNFKLCQNGGPVTSDTSGAVPAVTQLLLGTQFHGWVRRVMYHPQASSEVQLQGYTNA